MPKRDDIQSVLVIGSGPIVIGQAAEFDYSGTQACRVLREEGVRVILVNPNPATIMTDPDFADATYIEPITTEVLETIIAKEQPDAVLPTLGGQTALNAAIALDEAGILEKYGVELIGAKFEAINKGEDRQIFKELVIEAGRGGRAQPHRAHRRARPSTPPTDLGYPLVVRPSFTMGGLGSGFAYDQRRAGPHRRRRPAPEPDDRGAARGVDPRLEGVRARAHARHGRQHRRRLLDRERRPGRRAHRRLDHGRAGAHPDRPRVPAAARHRHRHHPRWSASTPAAATSSSPSSPTTGRIIVIEMNPRVSRSSALASKATGFPIAKIAAKLAIGYRLDEIPNDITGVHARRASSRPSTTSS